MMKGTLLLFAVGCSFEHGVSVGDNAGPDGGTTSHDSTTQPTNDAMGVSPPNCWSVAGVSVTVCLDAPLSNSIVIASNTTIDTDSSGTSALQCKPLASGSTDVCAIAASTITINGSRTLSAQGGRPLVLLASTIIINGTIDVGSHVGGQRGPNANASGCAAGNDATSNKGGGGQGGSFGTKGGDGGNQDNENGSRGIAGNTLSPTTLRGGCPGSDGGDGGGLAGDGGGALLLIADTLTFNTGAKINASGASGRGAGNGRRGGGGAGSGGMIVVSATTLNGGSVVQMFANGGHAGGGSSNDGNGESGTDSTSPTSTGGAGAGADKAGDGGAAYPASSLNGASASGDNDGGGGGGGGAGIIRNYSSGSLGTNISPPPS